MSMRRILSLLGLLSCIVLVSCGGGDDDRAGTSQTSSTRKFIQSSPASAPAPVLAGTWQQLPNPNYAPPNGPYVRDWTEMLWDPLRREIVIFGGNGPHLYENDIWSYNGSTANWTNLAPYTFCPGNSGFTQPNGTDDTAFKYDPVNNLYWAFGAGSGYRCLTYATVRTAGAGTTATSIVDASLAGSAVDAYTGWQVLANSTYSSVTAFDPVTNTLSLATPLPSLVPGSSYQLFATTGSGVWYYDPVAQTWTGQDTPGGNTGPTPTLARVAPAVAYSSADHAFALFSGWSGGSDRSVWKLDVNTKLWTKLPVPATGAPPSMTEMLNSFVYDPQNDVFILFGGACNYDANCPNGTLNGQTWAYKLSTNTWVNMNPPTAPAARAQQVMAYDSQNGVIVLYGGVTGPGVIANDVWYYHFPSNTWTQVTTPTSPPARYLAQIAYDPMAVRTVVFGGVGSTGSRADIWALTLAPAGTLPTVSLTAPASGASYTAPASITLAANAADSGGAITKVDFYAGSTLIGTSTTAPYSTTWSNVAAGNYTLTAVATDNGGASTTSAPVNVSVTAPVVNAPPTVSLSAPSSGSSYTAPASIVLAANASDSDGSISKVAFYAGSTLIGTSTAAPYSVTWTNVAAGSYTLTAVATDNGGASTTSVAVTVTVAAPSANQPPTVGLTAPVAGASYTEPAGITVSATAADADGTVAKVEFFAGTTSLGVDYVAPYSVTWSSVPAGTYTFTAVATDNSGASTSSAPVTVTVAAAPVGQSINVALQANGGVASASSQYDPQHPASAVNNGIRNGSNLGNGGVWTDGTPNKFPDWIQVNFNGAKTINQISVITLGDNFSTGAEPTPTQTFTLYGITDYNVQYWTGSTWATVPGGAITGNNLVWRTVSFPALTTTAVRVTVNGAATNLSFVTEVEAWTSGQTTNSPPTVSLTAPTSGASYTAPASITLAANAADSGGAITKVDFYAGSTLIGTSTTAPYSTTWSNVAAGNYTLTAVATDNGGASTTSAPVNVSVTAPVVNAPPTVSLSAPSSGSSYTAPASIVLAANASDSDGSISKVAFYAGSTLIGTSTAAPYSVTWTNVAAGSYTLTAVATDNGGASTTSVAVTVTVAAPSANQPPTVGLTAPVAGASYTEPAGITVSATAADADGTVAKVEFFAGTTSLGVDYVAPYSVTWSSVPAGTYTFTAVATDNSGASTSSAPVTVTVAAAPVGQSINVALQANGGVASASSQYDPQHPASAVNNGIRNGSNLGNGGVWTDGTPNKFPDWIQVNFNGAKTINQISVITLGDNFSTGAEPTPTQTFTLYGITDYNVQYWTGSTWATVPGGAITGNNLVWRTVSFPALTTTAVRVTVNGAATNLSFVTEVEAWTAAP